ncbi:hypothetical protein B0J13DRAFT_555987 [Dactylonectria estremocensis]|uniref:Zn(2)-C6 fungal-type domain-containing protein n=1 Tax=Dactylonectria estremocensis TaxID=1079267 RepID=A0A9P9ERS7_9HYPO|nr:hypothetical protein B0J13DRAFT_555987 [Dactylonectria estremocensis]
MDLPVQPGCSQPALACMSCKTQKIRCNRLKPKCGGCEVRGKTCIYPERRKIKKPNPPRRQPKEPKISDDAFSCLLERLLQVEEKCTQLRITNSSVDETPTESATLNGDSLKNYSGSSSLKPARSSEAESLVPSSNLRAEAEPVAKEPEASCSTNCLTTPMDVDVRLREAIKQVFCLKQQNLNKQVESVDFHLEPELAKACVKHFCTHFQIDSFPSFINMKLMHLIPEIVNMPEVSIEPVVLVLYYGILYHGSMLIETDGDPPGGNLTQQIYGCCLRALPPWRERALGTKTDLITAILLMRASFQQYDLDFSWDMYKLVSQCVKKLNLHNIDQGFVSTFIQPEDGADHDRKGLWALVFVDLFFRLLHNRPAIMTANLAEWRVNFPAMNSAPGHPQYVVPTLAFFVRSRLTFLLLGFFDLSDEEEEDRNSVIKRVEGLCTEIEDLAREWSLKDSMDANENNVSGWWSLYELTLTANCSMFIMSRKMEVLQSEPSGISSMSGDTPASLLSVNIARNVLKLAFLGIRKYTNSLAASYIFGAFRCYMPYGCLAKQLLNSDPNEPGSSALSDMELLEQIAGTLSAIAGKNDNLVPLARTLHELNIGIHAKWEKAG